jgi:MFS family permease
MTANQTSSRWVRIITVAFVMYTIAFIDRTNISLALPRISHDLHLDPQQAGTVAGIFYWGYLALQIPGGHLAKWWSPKKFISVLLVAWAVAAVGCGFVRSYRELLILRLLLGVAESGVFLNALAPTLSGFSVCQERSFFLRHFPAGCWTTGAGAPCS